MSSSYRSAGPVANPSSTHSTSKSHADIAPVQSPPIEEIRRKVAPDPQHTKSLSSEQYLLPTITAFYVFLLVNILAALYSPIQDCDEVFNYWEPTHYLTHGFGLQTWEYSPEYSIRSYLYIILHAIPSRLSRLFVWTAPKPFEFYFIRTLLGTMCALCESRLYATTARVLNPRIGIMFMIAMVSSPGMFHASVAYLPSSFAMYTIMLGMEAFMDWRGGFKSPRGIMWFGIGGIVGWPFAAALIAPFIMEELVLASITKEESVQIFHRYVNGITRCAIVVFLQLAVDAFFYHKLVVVPWEIVLYNVFSGSGRGPDIFGTEPWDFYIRNLLLNFNFWFVLAAAAWPLLGLQYAFRAVSTTRQTLLRNLVFTAPLYMWLAIFSLQSHKEERFMYPAYPCIALNAAIALHIVLSYFGNSDPNKLVGKVPAKVKFTVVSIFVILAVDVGVLRTLGLVSAYHAPLSIYKPLQRPEYAKMQENVCLGKDWYRFPSSYFLPEGMRAKFVKSAFNGLLPGQFNEATVGFGFFPGTWLVPPGMNDRNIEDPNKYIEIDHCQFLVDSAFPGGNTSTLEPDYALNTEDWEELQCSSFLDKSKTSLLGRLLWVPDWKGMPQRYRRSWGRHCLLRRRNQHDAT